MKRLRSGRKCTRSIPARRPRVSVWQRPTQRRKNTPKRFLTTRNWLSHSPTTRNSRTVWKRRRTALRASDVRARRAVALKKGGRRHRVARLLTVGTTGPIPRDITDHRNFKRELLVRG